MDRDVSGNEFCRGITGVAGPVVPGEVDLFEPADFSGFGRLRSGGCGQNENREQKFDDDLHNVTPCLA